MCSKFRTVFLMSSLLAQQCLSWEALPEIPSGRRSQFFVLQDDGSYKYGYDTGSGSAAKQAADAGNEVSGHYFYRAADGRNIDVKYTAGIKGFVPEGLEKLLSVPSSALPSLYLPPSLGYPKPSTSLDLPLAAASGNFQINPDGSYSFSYSAGDSARTETADATNNVRGGYSYRNSAGSHDLSYVAGATTGFLPTGGSLSVPNGLANSGKPPHPAKASSMATPSESGADISSSGPAPDGSYSFSFSTADQERSESADPSGNVQGRYSYRNPAGTHDLSYVAGSATGFRPTGGSLATPNGLGPQPPLASTGNFGGKINSNYLPPAEPSGDRSGDSQDDTGDASYSFSIDTPEYKRVESSDARGNVEGSFSYVNSAGMHDLSFVAGRRSGFQPTGGSLKTPPGLSEGQLNTGAQAASAAAPSAAGTSSGTASYELGNIVVHTYLPPNAGKNKFGYVLDSV